MEYTVPIKVIIPGNAKGEAIVSPDPISFLGEIDPMSGRITSKTNLIHDRVISNKIFVFPQGRGSTVGSYVIYNLKFFNSAPLAFVVNRAETIIVAGAILADIPLVESKQYDVTRIISSGDLVEIDSFNGLLKIKKNSAIKSN